ncbi:ATP-binding protein [Desulfomicrobium escambiense]|uniref:ATP-binding protein n=1 Tax=Desulfomicrobium escambiense TaxID=29503 RepID=UPI0003FB3775|nr:ATP-binding protein [Desulfomicrobium escambiense]
MIGKPKKFSLSDWVVGIGLLILLGAWVIALVVVRQERFTEIARAERHAVSLATVLTGHISGTMGRLESSLASLRSIWAANRDVAKMNVLLRHHVMSQPDLYNLISIIDASGNVVVTNLDDFNATFSGDRPFFLHHRGTAGRDMLVGAPVFGRVTGKWYMPVSIRLQDRQGKFDGVILASVNPYYFSTLFRELNLGEDALVYLAGRDGALYSGMGEAGELSLDTVVPTELADSVFVAGDRFLGVGQSILDGVDRIQCRSVIPGRDMFISVGLGLSESLAQWRTRTIVLLSLLFLLSSTYVLLLAWLRQAIVSREKASMELERFFTSVLDLLCIADTKGCFLRVNAQWEKTLGYTMPEIVGRCFMDFVHPDDVPSTREAIEKLKRQNEIESFTNRYRSKSGEYRHIEWRSSPQGDLIYAAARDITDRKEVEAVLRQSSEMLSLFIRHSPIYTFIKAVSPHESRTLYASDNYENMLGIKSVDMIGKTMLELFPPDLASAMTQDDWNVVSSGQIRRIDEDFNGRHYTSIKFPIPQGDRILLAGYTMDMTEIMHNQEALRLAKDAAETANRVKSEFLANMSHEIRTPLNGMMATLELLKTTSLSPEQEGLTDTVVSSCNRLTRLLSDILDLSRIEAGKLRIQQAPMSIGDVLAQTGDLFLPIAKEKGLELRFEIDPAIPDSMLGDAARLQQVLANMVGNALKFTHDGAVDVYAHALPGTLKNPCMVLFCVADTGIGISDESLSGLFNPFSQVSEGFTRSYQGAGLGLSICKRLVELMGGSICVVSEPGRGSSFFFSLPFGPAGPIRSAEAAEVHASCTLLPSSLSILLAEDDLVSAYATARLVEKLGLEVLHVVNGEQVLEALRERRFDLVFMDVQMPVMDGVAATRAIRAGAAGERVRNVPIVALTAYAMDGDRAIFLQAGMNDYLSKPVRLKELEAQITKWFVCDAAGA